MRASPALARAWHAATIAIIAASMIAQLVLVVRGVGTLVDQAGGTAPLAVRLLRFFSYFTIQSNLLALGTAATLIANSQRDGRTWRVVRIAAIVGMTVTFAVYMVLLRPIVHLEGIAKLCDIGFHYIAPVLTVLGWLLFGPWPRIDTRSLLRHLAWPVAYLLYILALGALSGWYPYPFLNAALMGYPRAIGNCLVIAAVLLVIGAVYHLLDAKLGGAKAQPLD
ncbi:MAG: Pr6Pr family membrane protein [Gemmatimonadaceae bacterium]